MYISVYIGHTYLNGVIRIVMTDRIIFVQPKDSAIVRYTTSTAIIGCLANNNNFYLNIYRFLLKFRITKWPDRHMTVFMEEICRDANINNYEEVINNIQRYKNLE